jgi:homoserine kinase
MHKALQHDWIRLRAPGTVANLVCGYDVLGLCLEAPFDLMEMRLLDERRVVVRSADGFPLPEDPERNTAGAPLMALMHEWADAPGFEVVIHKKIKPGSGIGSSAASAAGAVVGANHLLRNRFSSSDLVRLAMYGEEVASGVQHADNIAPCIYGGVTLIRCTAPLDIVPIPAPPLHITVIHPQIEVRTSDARRILRREVTLKDAVTQWGNVGGLVAGFMKNDLALISRSLSDVIVEPVRSILIPRFDELKRQCMAAGALGGGISGSGPSVFMLSADAETALRVEQAMQSVYTATGLSFHTYVTAISNTGVMLEK